jgi:hypothetical protein
MPPARVLWSAAAGAPLRGLALARERGRVVAWDADRHVHVFDRAGGLQARRQLPAAVAAACAADDGSAYAAVGAEGQVWRLAPDLAPRWERAAAPSGVAAALDPFGEHLAVADSGGGLALFDRGGKPLWKAACPRPLRFLAFAAERAVLAGSANFGLVACFDRTGRCLWRDTPVAHTGALTVSGDAGLIALACFGDGLCCYAADRPKPACRPAAAPCRLASASYDGTRLLTAGLEAKVALRSADGEVRAEWPVAAPPVALALGPLADWAAVGLPDGTLLALDTQA